MLDIKLIREQSDFVKEALAKRQMETGVIDDVLGLDEERRRLITHVFDHSSEAIVILDDQHRVVDFNKAVTTITGVSGLVSLIFRSKPMPSRFGMRRSVRTTSAPSC